MEAYAAVTSLLNLLENIQFYHARHSDFLDEQQTQLTYLGKQASFVQTYLETYHNGDGQDGKSLEIRIADKSREAEDIIEFLIGDDVLYQFLDKNEVSGYANNFSQRLETLSGEMDCIKNEVMGIKEKSILKDQKHQLSPAISSSRAPPGNDSMVGSHDVMKCIIDKLIRQNGRKIIAITGMGGIGKTTLAKNVYEHPASVQRFDIRCWVTISQEYDVREMLLCILRDMQASDEGDRFLQCHEMGVKVHKYLSRRRYLIVLDDMWSIHAWEEIQLYLPDDNIGSRIIVTSRLLGVANHFDSSNRFEMKLLDENESWNLLFKKVFIHESCPPEFEEIGKQIARNCKGLPLTIVVIGGLLAKSKMIRQDWKDILEHMSKIVMSGDDDQCFSILSLSYNHLPMYLKPCFIYMGVFPEDHSIRVSMITKLWVAEGFLKSIYGKSLEEVADDCLKDLIDRNLLYVDKFGLTGKMKACKIHDLLRDLCLREAQVCRFFSLVKDQSKHISQNASYVRRVAFNGKERNSFHELGLALQSASSLRTYLGHFGDHRPGSPMLTLSYYKLLRVLDDEDERYGLQDILQLVNARYLNIWSISNTKSLSVGGMIHHRNFFWNIQTLFLNYCAWNWEGLFIIWEMPQLRHLMVAKFSLPDNLNRFDGQDIAVLENLQTLAVVRNFRCTHKVLETMPNIKILKLIVGGGGDDNDIKSSLHSLSNLCHLHKLESLNCWFSTSSSIDLSDLFRQSINFPLSLRKLNLQWCNLEWDDMGKLIGEGIPQLEHLKLYGCCAGSEQWNPVEGQFDCLKVLQILRTGPMQWNADCVHFPCLEHLVLSCVDELKEIPPGLGEIETLRSISVAKGNNSLVASANEILEEQRKLGNEDLTLQIMNVFGDEE